MHTAKRQERETHIRSDDYRANNDELVMRLGSASTSSTSASSGVATVG
jgi:hypothetical protein